MSKFNINSPSDRWRAHTHMPKRTDAELMAASNSRCRMPSLAQALAQATDRFVVTVAHPHSESGGFIRIPLRFIPELITRRKAACAVGSRLSSDKYDRAFRSGNKQSKVFKAAEQLMVQLEQNQDDRNQWLLGEVVMHPETKALNQ